MEMHIKAELKNGFLDIYFNGKLAKGFPCEPEEAEALAKQEFKNIEFAYDNLGAIETQIHHWAEEIRGDL